MTTPASEPASRYSGIVTRTLAFVIDAAIIDVVAIGVAAALAIGISVLPGTHHVGGVALVIAGAVFSAWFVAYFATFWATTGQTPGARVMHIQVMRSDGTRLHAVRAIVRVAATVLAALPFLAGFVPILLTSRRRAFNDWVADTVVTHAPPATTVVTLQPTAARVASPRQVADSAQVSDAPSQQRAAARRGFRAGPTARVR